MNTIIPGSVLPDVLGSIQNLSPEEFTRRARRLKLLLTDNDGVWTDTGVYYSGDGEAFKRYSIRDGMGVERLRALGVETGIITGERSENLRKRSQKLRLAHLYLGVKDKEELLTTIISDTGFEPGEIAFIGDDVNDMEILRRVGREGLTAIPADAMPQVRPLAHYVCAWRGGNGAFRDFAEAIITSRVESA